MIANNNNSNVIDSKWPKITIPLVTVSRFLIEKLREVYSQNIHYSFVQQLENETKNRYTFNEVANDSLRMAQVLSDNGLKEGQNFGVCGYNSYEFITTLIGGLIIGGVAVPISARNITIERISNLIKEKHLKYLTLTTRSQKSLSKEALKAFNKGLKTIVSFTDEEYKELSNDSKDNETKDNYQCYRKHITSLKCQNESHIGVIKSVNPKIKNCLLVETNGSFDPSKSKSLFITDYSLLSQMTISSLPVTGFNWSINDTVLNTTSFTHINGLIQLFASLTSGSQFVIIEHNIQTNYSDLCKAIEEWGVSAAMFTPQMIIQMIKDESLDASALRSLSKVICTGASMPKNIGNKFIEKYGTQDFRQAYGLTEMCGFATIEPIGSTDFETSGVPVPGVSIKIVDTDSDVVLGATQVGEVYVKSAQLFNGYLSTIESNLLSSDLDQTIDSEGWFHTNDIGYYDRNSKLQIVDPIEDFIQYRSLHISPTSLEAILLSHFSVKEVAIFGTSHRQESQTPTALVVLKTSDKNQFSANDMTENLKRFINDHLIQQNISVDELYIVDEIPKTISGKINRTDLRQFVNDTLVNNYQDYNNKYLIEFN